MHIFCQTFSLPKEGRDYTDYEDACFPCNQNDIRMHIQEESNAAVFRAAVTDGATDSCFSQYWARLLAHAFGSGELQEPITPASLKKYQQAWKDYLSRQELPWYAEEKAEMGAFAALAGLSLFSEEQRWKALAIGDCCLVHARGGTLLQAFPMESSEDFSRFPMLVGSMPERNTKVFEQVRVFENGHWEPGDFFFLMSDALACWFLKNVEDGDGELAIKLLCRIDDHDSFAHLMQHQRNQLSADGTARMLNDDSTLVRVAVSNQRFMAGGSSAIIGKDEFLATLKQLNSRGPKRKTATVEMPVPSTVPGNQQRQNRQVASAPGRDKKVDDAAAKGAGGSAAAPNGAESIAGAAAAAGIGTEYGTSTADGGDTASSVSTAYGIRTTNSVDTIDGAGTEHGDDTRTGSSTKYGDSTKNGTGLGGSGSRARVEHSDRNARILVVAAISLIFLLIAGGAFLMLRSQNDGSKVRGEQTEEFKMTPADHTDRAQSAATTPGSTATTAPKTSSRKQSSRKASPPGKRKDTIAVPVPEPIVVRPEPEPEPQVPHLPEAAKPSPSPPDSLWDRLAGKRKGSNPGVSTNPATRPPGDFLPDNLPRSSKRSNPLENLLPKDISRQFPQTGGRRKSRGGDSNLIPPTDGGARKDGEVDPVLPDIKPHEGDKVRKFQGG